MTCQIISTLYLTNKLPLLHSVKQYDVCGKNLAAQRSSFQRWLCLHTWTFRMPQYIALH